MTSTCHTLVQELKISAKHKLPQPEGERPRAVPFQATNESGRILQQASVPERAKVELAKRAPQSNVEAGREAASSSHASKKPAKTPTPTDRYVH